MEERDLTGGEARLPGEVVEIYRRPEPREVVEQYVRPLPGRQAVPQEKPRRRRTGLLVFLACFAVTVLLAGGLCLWNAVRQSAQTTSGSQDTGTEEITIPTYPYGEGASLTVESTHGETMTAQAIYQQVNPAVVTVLAQLKESISVGTGVIFSQDGYILTNYHVLKGGRNCSVALDTGEVFEVQYVAGDAENDLAVLKADREDLPVATFGDSDQLTVGDKVYAIGNPLGVELRGTLTDGIVSAINRNVKVSGRTMTLIQTNAALNSGNSGGPLINEYGQVVGINVIKMTSNYSNIEGLGFAIPSASMRRIINDLLTYGETQPEPLLGVTVLTSARQLSEEVWGLEIQEVVEGSAADLAGIRAGDFLVSAGGETLSTSQDLLRVRQLYHIGDEMPATIWRDGELIDVTLELTDAVEES